MATTESAVPRPTHEPPRVLVVDDDPQLGELLHRYLGGQGLDVRVVADGGQLREALGTGAFDVVLLDLGLPGEDGLVLMRELRARWQGPVIIVSGRGEPVERIVGLELGADDYVSKPFDLRELLARIRSVLRRSVPLPTAATGRRYFFDDLELDVLGRRLTGRAGEDILLTTGEFNLLLAFLAQPHQVMSRDRLMSLVHGHVAGPFDRSIDMQVGRLRRKVERDAGAPRLIQAVRGAGYVLSSAVRASAT